MIPSRMFCGHGLMKWVWIDVHKIVTKIERINALRFSINKIYILVLDKTNGILYHVARNGSPSEDFYFLLYSYVTQDTQEKENQT